MSLRYARSVAWTGLLSLSIALVYAVAAGSFRVDGLELLENPWGLATLVDIYVGFALFSCWVVWREANLGKALIWIALILVGGNLISALYVLVALHGSRGDVLAFWLGSHRASKDVSDRPDRLNYRN